MPNDVYIKQADAVVAVQKRIEQIGMENNPYVCSIRQAVRDVPAADVEPKRKTGRWVYKHRTQVHYHKETGEDVMTGEKRTVMVYDDLSGKYPHCPYCDALAADSFMDYCPHCGAKMLPEPPKGEENA